MTETTVDSSSRLSPRLRFEIIFASICLAFGLFVLPAAIFGVGTLLLGPYGNGGGIGAFYVDFFADLAKPSARAWLIAIGPWALLTLLRLLLTPSKKATTTDDAAHQPPPVRPADSSRVEPKVSLD